MAEPTICEAVAEACARGKQLTGALAAHAADCVVCREVQGIMAKLRSAGTAFPTPPSPHLLVRIHQAVAAEPLPTATTVTPSHANTATTLSGSLVTKPMALILGCILFAGGVGILGHLFFKPPTSSSSPGFGPSIQSSAPPQGNSQKGLPDGLRTSAPASTTASATSPSTSNEEMNEHR